MCPFNTKYGSFYNKGITPILSLLRAAVAFDCLSFLAATSTALFLYFGFLTAAASFFLFTVLLAAAAVSCISFLATATTAFFLGFASYNSCLVANLGKALGDVLWSSLVGIIFDSYFLVGYAGGNLVDSLLKAQVAFDLVLAVLSVHLWKSGELYCLDVFCKHADGKYQHSGYCHNLFHNFSFLL